MNGLAVTSKIVFECSDWSRILRTVERKPMKLGLKMTAMFINGEAKPIGIQISAAVWKILAEMRFRSLRF